MTAPRLCRAEGCDRPHYARGMCRKHYERWSRSDPDRPTCKVDGCGGHLKALGLCVKHYARLRRTDPARAACAIEGCEDRAISLGWCSRHYKRWLSAGSPSIVRDGATHGHSRGGSVSPTYLSWEAMIASCTRPSSNGYGYYGGRGITVCDRWRDFENFLADMRERPPGKVLGRIDVDGDYTPANCRWVTRKEQHARRRAAGRLSEVTPR